MAVGRVIKNASIEDFQNLLGFESRLTDWQKSLPLSFRVDKDPHLNSGINSSGPNNISDDRLKSPLTAVMPWKQGLILQAR